MQQVEAARFGGPDVLHAREGPDPAAGPGEVVLGVAAADVLMLDVLVRRGSPGPWNVRPPYVPGTGVAGTVAAVGPGVDAAWVGRRVAAKPGRAVAASAGSGNVADAAEGSAPVGGYAELAVAPAAALVAVPDGVGLREAAALVNDGMTAMLIARAAAVRGGENVLVTPAGGGLGSLLVQLVRAAGATVIAGAGGRSKLDLARGLGAHHTLDYSCRGWVAAVRDATGGTGADVVLDGVGGEIGAASFDAVARGGRFFAYGAPAGGFTRVEPQRARERDVSAVSLLEVPMRAGDHTRLPEAALAAAAAGTLAPTIGQAFRLRSARDAHRAIEDRAALGKTLLLP
ncbi:zinc-binding dehydrogenase [Streptomonospora salina]|uniref:NADPH2:quinone reductase n=1 Tax=Streptomonospora salina TaxID=104205 RepID=A0A841EC09_9ACTN|nr:zinc-binding dehydrogenase [Streptomonospora salina]MBB5998859.1 NADPH2:quinone reductase [Streptomonospora salina]